MNGEAVREAGGVQMGSQGGHEGRNGIAIEKIEQIPEQAYIELYILGEVQ